MNAFLKGIASIFDFWGVLSEPHVIPKTPEEAAQMDAEALRKDWEVVLNDIRIATKQYTLVKEEEKDNKK